MRNFTTASSRKMLNSSGARARVLPKAPMRSRTPDSGSGRHDHRKIHSLPVDMVVLSPAMIPRGDSKDIARLFNLSTDKQGFFMERHPKLAPLSTMSEGIFIAGVCQSPKDIPDTVAQANGAAAEALTIVVNG